MLYFKKMLYLIKREKRNLLVGTGVVVVVVVVVVGADIIKYQKGHILA